MKKNIALLCMLLLLSVAGCGGGAPAREVSVDLLFDQITEKIEADLHQAGFKDEDFAAEELPGYIIFDLKGEDSDFVLTTVDKDKVEEGFVIAGSTMFNSDQIAVIKAVPGETDAIKKALEAEQQAQVELWEDYLPAQAEKVQKTIITARDDYLIYITYPDPEAIEEIFSKAFEDK